MDDVEIKNWWRGLISYGFRRRNSKSLIFVEHLESTMGVQNAAAVLHSIEKLALDHVFNVSKYLAEKCDSSRAPTVVIDASWVGIKGGNRADPVSYMIGVIKALLGCGL